jgi:hypothetical protein
MCVLSLLVLVSAPCDAAAQAPPSVRFGAGLSGDLLVGDASDFLDGAVGQFLMADIRIDSADRFRIRLDAGLTGLVDDEDQGTGAVAMNDVVTLLAGPQLTGHIGRFDPYVGGLAGMLAILWSTEQPGADDNSGAEAGLAWGAHAGLGFTLDAGSHPVVLLAEARILDTGTFSFARAPDPVNTGSPTGLIRADFAALSIRVGVTLGF